MESHAPVFRNIGREHGHELKGRFAVNDEFLGPDKFHPKYNQVKSNDKS